MVRVPPHHHVFTDRHLREQADVLKRPRHAHDGDLKGFQVGDVLIQEHDLAIGASVHAAQEVEKRGLSGSVRPDHRMDVPGFDGKINAPQSAEAVESL
jgi:hypothetical protein